MTVGCESAGQDLTRVVSRSEDAVAPRLVVKIWLSQASEDLVNGAPPKRTTALALVDTGATKSCVCKELLKSIEAEPWDKVAQIGVGGMRDCYVHYANIALLDHDDVEFAAFPSVKVIDFVASQHDQIRVLLGMDILGRFSQIRLLGFELDFGSFL
jgi:hypothetical protein